MKRAIGILVVVQVVFALVAAGVMLWAAHGGGEGSEQLRLLFDYLDSPFNGWF